MKKVFALVLLLPILLTGCLEIFFASPMDLAKSPPYKGWEHVIVVHDQVQEQLSTPPEITAAFSPDGLLTLAYRSIYEPGKIFLRTLNASADGFILSDDILLTAGNIALAVSPDGTPYVSCQSNNISLHILSWPGGIRQVFSTNLGGDIQSDIVFDTDGIPLVGAAYGSSLQLLKYSSPTSYTNFFITSLNSPISLQMFRTGIGQTVIFSLLYTGSFFHPTLLCLPDSGAAWQKDDPAIQSYSWDVFQRARFSPEDNSVHAAVISNDALVFRRLPLDGIQDWASDKTTISSLPGSIKGTSMVRNTLDNTLYLGFIHEDALYAATQYRIHLLRYRSSATGWEYMTDPITSPSIGAFTLAFNPVENKVWMACTMNNTNTLNYDLSVYRFNP